MTRVVLLGGSSGIGLATAKRCADAGWDVIVASREPERADVPGEKAALDVTDAAAVRAFFDARGGIDHLVSTTVARAPAARSSSSTSTPHAAPSRRSCGAL